MSHLYMNLCQDQTRDDVPSERQIRQETVKITNEGYVRKINKQVNYSYFSFNYNKNVFYFFVWFVSERLTPPAKLKKFKFEEGGYKYIIGKLKVTFGVHRNVYKL